LEADGGIGAEIPRADGFDPGAFPHQIRDVPGEGRAVFVARGAKGFGGPSYSAGGLKMIRFDRGRVENLHTVSPGPAAAPHGFNPRHIDFHPTLPFVFVSLEGQHELCVFRLAGGEIEPVPLFVRNTLAAPGRIWPRQDLGTVHVHPSGRFVYVANRNDGYIGGYQGPSWITPDPVPEFPGGENSIAVFAVDQATGEPTLVQTIDSGGLHPRTFSLDPTGRILTVCNVVPTVMRVDGARVEVPANLAVFRVGDDGRLSFLRRYDLEVGTEKCWWSGTVA
jgi:hypothetical protein